MRIDAPRVTGHWPSQAIIRLDPVRNGFNVGSLLRHLARDAPPAADGAARGGVRPNNLEALPLLLRTNVLALLDAMKPRFPLAQVLHMPSLESSEGVRRAEGGCARSLARSSSTSTCGQRHWMPRLAVLHAKVGTAGSRFSSAAGWGWGLASSSERSRNARRSSAGTQSICWREDWGLACGRQRRRLPALVRCHARPAFTFACKRS